MGTKIILVLGHTKCGAIIGACNNVELGKLTQVLEKIKPAIELEKITVENRTGSNRDFVDSVTENNVHLTITRIKKESSVIAGLVQQGKLKIAGALYDVETGKVRFYDE